MKAAIDIGTNTVLLLIAEVKGGSITVIHEEQRIPRLGQGVDSTNLLQRDSIERVLQSLSEYKVIIDRDYPEVSKVVVTATSAVRDAENRDIFIKKVKDQTSYDIRLLSGDEEAQYTFRGALSVLNLAEDESGFVLDIGGGSTELALGTSKVLSQYYSMDMGSVRFKERFLFHNPPLEEEVHNCRNEIEKLLNKKKFNIPEKVNAIGVAGTATSLAAMDLKIDIYDKALINGHKIKTKMLTDIIDIMSEKTYEEILELNPEFMKGREDIILPGFLIMEGFLKFYDLPEIMISTGGIRHGALLMAEKV